MYVMSYFTTASETLHLAASDDGLRWRAIDNGAPIWAATRPGEVVRDPFLCRSADGVFHLLYTIGWQEHSIGHAASGDLMHWETQPLLPVMASVPAVRNCWAPEAVWDADADGWRLVWSSSVTEPSSGSDANHRIWSCVTRDWRTVTPPATLFDPGYSVIDATIAPRDTGDFLMAFKDERGHNPPRHEEAGQRKAIGIALAPRAAGPYVEATDLVTPPLTEGPLLYRRGAEWMMLFDHFTEERFGALQSRDGLNWKAPPRAPILPPGLRHASVLQVPDATGQALE